jgi:hypothetical protein
MKMNYEMSKGIEKDAEEMRMVRRTYCSVKKNAFGRRRGGGKQKKQKKKF